MQKLKSDIQKTILDAAEYLFIRKGYKNTAMREIAAKADVGLSNIYNYFPEQRQLIQVHFATGSRRALYHALQPRRKQSKSRNVHQP